jgi:hypothetical protein
MGNGFGARGVAVLLGAFVLSGAGCGSDARDSGGGGASGTGGTGGGGGGAGGQIDPGTCGDGDCRLKAGENTSTCPEDCGKPGTASADVQFFADFDSKAVEYGNTIRFTYVVWNAGPSTAKNVVLPVPMVQNATTTIYGSRHYCETGGQKYDCMVDLSYVPGSMRINRVYHPNRAKNSYYYVDTVPLSDAPDGDEGYWDATQKLLYLTLPELRSRDSEPEDAGVIWSYELAVDGGAAHTPCESKPRIQNWNYVFADNAPDFMNDIIGHILCTSPRLRAEVSPDKTSAQAKKTVTWTVKMSYDDAEPPAGLDKSRFDVMRPWLYFAYPEKLLEVTGIDKSGDAEDLPGKSSSDAGGGVVYWQRKNAAGQGIMAPAESDTLTITTKVLATAPTGSKLSVQAHVVSQNTLPYQEVDAEAVATVTAGATPGCGDGICSPGSESATSCPLDCPECVGENGITSFSEPACCPGLTLVRAAHPYSWAYDQCYEWEGGGVPLVQGYCVQCGDGKCTGEEDACNCPGDCGPHCGNWICETGEDRSNCPADC